MITHLQPGARSPAATAGRRRRSPTGWPAAAALLLAAGSRLLTPAAARAGDEPPYPHGAFREDCALCHTSGSWSPARLSNDFDHARYGLRLEGAHQGAPCLSCHGDLEFATVRGSSCKDCHQDVHRGVFGLDCDQCHGTRNFIDRADEVRSHRLTRFPLTGTHLTLDCDGCHGTAGSGPLTFVNTPVDCINCHRDTYQAATPDHVASGFPDDCTQCHSTVGWGGSDFDHALTGFALAGAHRALQCADCHDGARFGGLSGECYACHQADFEGVQTPDHVAGGYSQQCLDCHAQQAWQPATFDHGQTRFPLAGAHRVLRCADCHDTGDPGTLATECYACHQADFESVQSPDHVASGFSQQCLDCHSQQAWDPATFDHAATRFPLTGAHQSTACNTCHIDAVYAGTPRDCLACHLADYQQTANPRHDAAGIGTDCAACHSTRQWGGAQGFDHDGRWFPIYSGKHRNKWDSCTDCHTAPSDFGVFNCLGCHPHNDRGKTDRKHRGRNGYRYESQACYRCHPRGRE